MERLVFKTDPAPCEYLPDQQWQLLYEVAPQLRAEDYMQRLSAGWRRFGPVVFRPDCPECRQCQSLRVPVATFRPPESQRRVWKRNAGQVTVTVGNPAITPERLELFAKFHAHGHRTKGWREPEPGHGDLGLHMLNPFPTEEWSYWIGDRLVGIGYVDALPEGLSAIYFFHDPEQHQRSLGTFNILTMIDTARRRGLPHVYLGYYVAGYRSLEYKARFRPNEVLSGAGWKPFAR